MLEHNGRSHDLFKDWFEEWLPPNQNPSGRQVKDRLQDEGWFIWMVGHAFWPIKRSEYLYESKDILIYSKSKEQHLDHSHKFVPPWEGKTFMPP
jgi:hypothetical protein